MADLYSDKNAFSSLWYDENKKREMIFAYVTSGQMMIREKCYFCERRPIEIGSPRYPTTFPMYHMTIASRKI